ncbi:unnamed protein product [Nippostrongylus brasiliensis]|uniref:Pyridine nucleotide-disulfide oxidoreductase domain-containing protein 2 n=1 Tax=Nippostrongylus brasiliensis TaxID=27835 RepID=A0A0N4YPN3_NIPBR|nr:unnamed protein product [Nippostrongylus brasiliensis]
MQSGALAFTRRLSSSPRDIYDVIVIGGGHNGLTAAAYMAKAGKRVCVLERREVIGGAAVTEEIIPGFKFSRASYLLSLLRPIVINDLQLKKHGLRYHIRNPSSFTPIRGSHESLLLGLDMKENQKEIAKFSKHDAEVFPKYEEFIHRTVCALEPLMDQVPLNLHEPNNFQLLRNAWKVLKAGKSNCAHIA